MGRSGADLTYEAAGPDVLWEVFEDEVVVINLDNGCYYALDATGGFIFDLLVNGVPTGAVVDRVHEAYEGARGVVDSEVRRFADRLLDAGLLRARNGDPGSVDTGVEPPATKATFQPPQMRAYTDMQDLLMIDPIHDVDETGWPVRRDPGGH
jgi:hypothetical protein